MFLSILVGLLFVGVCDVCLSLLQHGKLLVFLTVALLAYEKRMVAHTPSVLCVEATGRGV